MTKRTRKWLILLMSAVGLFLLGTALLIFAGLRDQIGKADIALVLGSKVEPDGTPSQRLRARLDKTIELFRAGYFPTVIASGGVGKEGFDEAVVMRDYLVSHGIPTDRVIVDSGGTTTYESAKKAAQIMGEKGLSSAFVISQYFHIPRARLAMHRFGIATVYSAHANYFESRDLYSTPRELIGYISYALRGFETPK